MIEPAQALDVQTIGEFCDRLVRIGQHPGRIVDPQFVDELGRSAPEVFAEDLAEILRRVAGELLHAFESRDEILRSPHFFAETFEPFRSVGPSGGFARQEEAGEQVGEQHLEPDLANRGRNSLCIQTQQFEREFVHAALRQLENGREDTLSVTVQKCVVLEITADRHEELQMKGEQQQFAPGRSGGRKKAVPVVRPHKDDAVRFEELFFSVDAVHDRSRQQEDQLAELVRMFDRPPRGEGVVVQIAAARNGGLPPPRVPADRVKRHLRPDCRIDEVVQFQCDWFHAD